MKCQKRLLMTNVLVANPRYPLISEIKDIYLKVYYG